MPKQPNRSGQIEQIYQLEADAIVRYERALGLEHDVSVRPQATLVGACAVGCSACEQIDEATRLLRRVRDFRGRLRSILEVAALSAARNRGAGGAKAAKDRSREIDDLIRKAIADRKASGRPLRWDLIQQDLVKGAEEDIRNGRWPRLVLLNPAALPAIEAAFARRSPNGRVVPKPGWVKRVSESTIRRRLRECQS